MLSIFLAEKLERTPNKLFLQYFCDNKEDKRNTAVTILRGLISQLLNLRRKLFDHILPKFRVQKEHFFSFETLWRIFESMVCDPALETTYCVLDGVDECDEASLEILLGKFATLLSAKTDESSACHLNLLIVSRDVPDSIPCLLSSFPRISLDPDADAEIDKDINLFIKAKVEELSRYRQYPKALRVYVEKVFRERAQGTFLWIGIAAQALRKYKATEVEKALDLFPQGLDKLYARMLLQIDDSRREIAARILRWVVMAVRPLTLSQLSTAIQTTVEPSNVLFDRDEKIRDQVSYCGCFVVVNKDVVSLIHQSAKDYLLRKTWDSNPELEAFRVEEKVANLEIAKRCLDYLQSGALENSKDDVLEDTRHLSSYPLLSYATLHWHEHARSLARSADIFDLSLPFYHPDSQIRRSWWEAYLFWKRKRPSDKDRSWVNPPKDLPLLHLASHLGILPLVQNLVLTEGRTTRGDSFFLLSKADSHGMTALMRAAENGHEAIAQLLLEKGADIQTQDLFGQTAMTRTATRGHEAVVRLLLENGANVNAKDKFGKTALMRAAACGYETVTRLLLENGANFNAENRNRETALIEAVNYEHTAVIQLLLEKGCNMEVRGFNDETALMKAAANETVTRLLLENGANVNAKDAFGRTALMKAAAYGNETVTRLLLKNGANVNAKDEIGRTALMKAAACGYETVTRLLLKNGANLNAEKRNGETALMRAAEYGYETITRLLLENGANVNAENNDGETALMKAAACGYETITRLLLENGANLNAEKRNGETALMKAAEYGHETVTRLLLENGANVNAENNDGETALMRAAEYGYETIIRLLLEKGANVNAKKRNGETALIEAVEYRYTAIIQLLLEKGANINAENNDGETALMRAAVYRNETVTRLLLKNGANVNAKDEIGRTALMIAAASGYETVTRLLLKNGADIDAEDRNGDTALMMAAEHIFKDWREPIVRLLLKNGANVNARNQYAQTALSKAILYGHENAVQLLLEKGAVMEDTEA